ncbi:MULTISPECIES: DUF427 domain-containing protein [unclassified Frankia]|uniref:DUF427 domain-containing protein n=1 Tax=unclassified Frankia TaxID=2632575 RepID=UPI0027DD7DA0|nr:MULTISPECIES: DUF427 domain-containing protein [unclassified Frankia]
MLPVTNDAGPDSAQAIEHVPCRYRARAWWDGRLVAESTAAVRVSEPGRSPELYFPTADVRFELVGAAGGQAVCPVKGTARLWTLDGKSPAPRPEWQDPEQAGGDGLVDGQAAVWSFTEPAPGLDWLADLVAFDHDRVRVEIVDLVAGEDPREASVKQFPNWGDAADLIDMMDLRIVGERRQVSAIRPFAARSVVEASQILGQAIVAAMRHTGGRRVVSAQLVMYRVADTRIPLEFDLEDLSSGRTFSAVLVHVSQEGRRRASVNMLLDVTAADVFRYEEPTPPVAGPYDAVPYDMSVTGRDLRVVDAAYNNDSNAPVGPPTLDAWVKFREVPADPALHAGLLAQFTGHMSLAAAMRPHAGFGQDQAHRTLSMGISAIGIALHADIRADQWMRYHHHSTFVGDGMAHAENRVYTEAGVLVASFTVDATLRGLEAKFHHSDKTAI